MEHAVPFEAVRPWRTAAVVASGVAAVELLALIVTATFLLGHSVTSHGAAAAAKASTKPATKTPAARTILPRTKTRVIVLNGNGQAGAAASEAAAIRSRGYRIGSRQTAVR